jgi:glycosyltransferase involved in cell wall biosynthesis
MISHRGAIIINFGLNIYDISYFSSKDLNCKIIYAETNASDKYRSERFFDLIQKKIKKSDSLVFQTVEERKDHNSDKNKNAYVIHNPIKPDLPQPYNGTRNKTIVNFCRLSRQKNLILLMQAFEKLHTEFPDYILELYADTSDPHNTEYKNELMSYISSNNLESCVFLLPPSSDIHNIILKSAMFVSSSDYEGISNSMIEAMAIGLPCVCTDCLGGGAREMITDGESGLLVPMNDADALAKAMCRMVEDEALSAKCSENAAKVRKTHKVESIAAQWLEVIEKIN